MELKGIDLNLLVVMHHLFKARSVSRVAEQLELSQPAVSNALARLRKLLGDPLFVRTPAGMQPTPFAEQLAEPVAQALATIHGAFNQRADFAPIHSERVFTLGLTDIGEIYFLPTLMNAIAQAAPGVSISTLRNTAINLKEQMEAGLVDLAIGLLPQLKSGFFRRRLFVQRYVCLFRKGHRLDKRRVSLPEFCAAEHVVVVSPGTGHGKVDELLERSGVRRKVRLTVPHFVAVGHILRHTDMVATVPERLAQALVEPFGLTYTAHPATVPEIAISVFWHAKVHKDLASQWLRGLVFDTFAD